MGGEDTGGQVPSRFPRLRLGDGYNGAFPHSFHIRMELLEEFEQASTRENSPTSDGFFAKIKSLFDN